VPGERRRVVRQNDLRRARMQADQHGVGPQFQCVTHDVKTGWHINGAMLRDRFLKYVRIVSMSIALRAQVRAGSPKYRKQAGELNRKQLVLALRPTARHQSEFQFPAQLLYRQNVIQEKKFLLNKFLTVRAKCFPLSRMRRRSEHCCK